MDVINQPSGWFRSEAGASAFAACSTLEDRIIFLYSYLKTVTNPKADEHHLLFKAALFFADAVLNSDEEYASYNNLVDPAANPFLAYLTNLKKHPGNEMIFVAFLCAIHGHADLANQTSWIYNPEDLYLADFNLMIEEKTGFLPMTNAFVDPEKFHVPENKQMMQLAVIWLWGKEEDA